MLQRFVGLVDEGGQALGARFRVAVVQIRVGAGLELKEFSLEMGEIDGEGPGRRRAGGEGGGKESVVCLTPGRFLLGNCRRDYVSSRR